MSVRTIEHLKNVFFIISIISFIIFQFLLHLNVKQTVNISIDKSDYPLHVVDKEFISFGIDTVEILSKNFRERLRSTRIRNLTRYLSPSRLRFGGTMSDRLIFIPSGKQVDKDLPFFTVDEEDLFQLFNFTQDVGSRLLFDLNALLRSGDDWNPSNAIEIMKFCKENSLAVDWQLGNEPNSFRHVFNTTVTPFQLSNDYYVLRQLLHMYTPDSLLTGPDTTRPQPKRPDCVLYMKEFLSKSANIIDVISWHQYYLNGRTATLEDFWNVDTLELLHSQINTMNLNIAKYRQNLPMWLTETSSAYGGGSPGLSNSYAGTPLWIDKLGLAARSGINVVVRQSLIGANYSLIDEEGNPSPDWWISFMHKVLVGRKVVKCDGDSSNSVRVYCHCTPYEYIETNSVTVFAINLDLNPKKIIFKGSALNDNVEVEEFIITPLNNDRLSKIIKINNKIADVAQLDAIRNLPKKLALNDGIEMPPYSSAFWVLYNVQMEFCMS